MKARLNIIMGALLFSTGGVAIKAVTLTGWQISSLRCLVAAITLLLVLPSARNNWTWRSFIVAIPYAATFTLYTFANKYTTAANAIFLQDTAPLYILLLGPVLLNEKISRRDLVFLVLMVVGLLLIFTSNGEASLTATHPTLGNLLAACAGVTWALTIVGLRWLAVRSQRFDDRPATAVVGGSFLAFFFCGFFAFPMESVAVTDGLIITYLGVFQIALAYVFVTHGIRDVPALESSLLLLVEPLLSPVWAWVIFEEGLEVIAILGGMLIILDTALHIVRRAPA